MWVAAFIISFSSAFLLFLIQPMATRAVLPNLGGSPAVWNTAMLVFQMLLLAGYFYAFLLTRYVAPRRQPWVHLVIAMVSLTCIPLRIFIGASGEESVLHPVSTLLTALVSQLGMPFFVLASTAPLLQFWVGVSRTSLAKNPYVLYSSSNLGSMVALLGYILVMEPISTLAQQQAFWSVFYVVAIAGVALIGCFLVRLSGERKAAQKISDTTSSVEHGMAFWRTCAVWVLLAFIPSSLSLGVTTYITTDIASMPFLWVIPLTIYLLSFVDAFASKPKIVPFALRYATFAGAAMLMLIAYGKQGYTGYFVLHLIGFSLLAFAVHGFLARLKPSHDRLTTFYFCLSIGGALGGMFNSIIAPAIFRSAIEYPLSIALAVAVLTYIAQAHQEAQKFKLWHVAYCGIAVLGLSGALYLGLAQSAGMFLQAVAAFNANIFTYASLIAAVLIALAARRAPVIVTVCTLAALSTIVVGDKYAFGLKLLHQDRNFFGVQRVMESADGTYREIQHNTVIHGLQLLDAQKRLTPVSYYYLTGEAIRSLPELRHLPMGDIGLGAGSVQCFALPGQQVDLYEINPLNAEVAENKDYFTFLSDCPGSHKIILGDGRITLAGVPDHRYGILIVDAFSGDSIPAHLLTVEAMQLYMQKLVKGGVLIINTTNHHLDLWPLLAKQAEAVGAVAYGKEFTRLDKENQLFPARWVVITQSRRSLDTLLTREKDWQPLIPSPDDRTWTDQYTNLLPYFKVFR